MGQKKIELTPQTIEMIREKSHQKWRDCQRKDYYIYATKAPAGYIFANKLEQPLSYKAIMKYNNNNPFISEERISRNKTLTEYVKSHGYYHTDGNMVVLCGTRGELWTVKPEKVASSYILPDNSPIKNLPDGWFVVKRASETRPNSVAIQLPIKYHGIYEQSWATLHANDNNSPGHGKGDILVAPKLPDGSPDYSDMSPTNNEVFALTYNQSVGGWNRTNMILDIKSIKPLSLEYVKSTFVFSEKRTNSKYLNLAKALTFVEYYSMHMDDYFLDSVEYICNLAKIKLTGDSDNMDYLRKKATEGYLILLSNPSNYPNLIDYIKSQLEYREDMLEYIISKGNKHSRKVLSALLIIENFLKGNKKYDGATEGLKIIKKLKSIDIELTTIATAVGCTYWRYLDNNYYFLSNDSRTVGSTVEGVNHKGFKPVYVAYSQIKGTSKGYAIAFGRDNTKSMAVKIYEYSDSSYTLGKCISYATFNNKTSIEKLSKEIANVINSATKSRK